VIFTPVGEGVMAEAVFPRLAAAVVIMRTVFCIAATAYDELSLIAG
jgi:hypothetical protein